MSGRGYFLASLLRQQNVLPGFQTAVLGLGSTRLERVLYTPRGDHVGELFSCRGGSQNALLCLRYVTA